MRMYSQLEFSLLCQMHRKKRTLRQFVEVTTSCVDFDSRKLRNISCTCLCISSQGLAYSAKGCCSIH